MEGLIQIIRRRHTPGVLIFGRNSDLLYFNNEAIKIIPGLKNFPKRGNEKGIHKEIVDLCNELEMKMRAKFPPYEANDNCMVLHKLSGGPYSMRAFFIGRDEEDIPSHIMVLAEKITKKHDVDFEQTKREFNLTNRELEVLRLICDGNTNKEISKKLFICEYTVKDHIKKIMEKMQVNSRGG